MSLVATTTAWQELAACINVETSIFFPLSTGEFLGRPSSTAWKQARDICGVCTVRLKCLDFAIYNRLNDGMYGGKTPEERNAIRNRRRREEKSWVVP